MREWFHANPGEWRLFRKRYLKELFAPAAAAAVEKLYQLAKGKQTLTLLYGSRNQENNNAVVLKELLDGTPKPPSSVGRAAIGRGRMRKAKRQ